MIKVPNGVTLVLNGNGHQAIVNTAYPFYVNNANIQMNDLTITGKATYAIFTKGSIWDYNGNNATVNASFNNVTVDLDKANNFPVTFNGMGNITMKDCTVKGAGLPSGDYADGMHVFAGAEINLTVDGGEIGGIMLNSNYAAAATMDVKNGAVIEKVDLEVSSASDGSNVVAPVTVSADSTVKDMFHAVYSANQLVKVLEAGGNALLVNNITTSNKLTVKDGAYLDGNGKTFNGVMTVFGNGRKATAALTIKNINFVAANGASSCIVSPDRSVNNAYSYSSNVTVDNCTFTDPDGVVNCAAVRHEDGGDSNWKIVNCVVDNTMHSLIQTNNVELDGLTIQGCKVYSKNGINLNQCTKVSIIDCIIDVKGYAVRYGVAGATVNGTFEITGSTLKSANNDGDAVIIFRGTMTGSTLTLVDTTITGAPEFSGNANVVR